VVHPPGSASERRPATPFSRASDDPLFRILVIEDDEDARITLRRLLEIRGYSVEEAADGARGLAMIRASRPDVAVIDIGLPSLDGYTLARDLRAERDGDRIFLIALTGYGEVEDRREAVEAGFDAHLVKPVKVEQLYAALAKACRRDEM
jgi:CheY-like chemotaxis protein